MRGLSFFDKVVLAINILFVILLFLACLSPYLSVKSFPFLPFLGLTVPALVTANLLFFGYWSLKRKWQLCLSLLALLVGYFSLGSFIRFGNTNYEIAADDFTVLSYNVRQFNRSGSIENEMIFEDIKMFLEEQKPDIVCFQEVSYLNRMKRFNYPYKYFAYKSMGRKTRLGIFSKYPIANAAIVPLRNTNNNACYADIVVKEDTIRVYNLHMQSLGITPGRGIIRRSSSDKLYKKLTASFKKQEDQAQYILEHSKGVSYKKLVCGDFNNSQYSRTYNLIKEDKKDSFEEAGRGYGRTYIFHGLPVRIDFILADPELGVTSHKNFDLKYSDHFPIMASFRLNED